MSALDITRIIFLPLVPIYFLIISLRNFLFDKNIFKEKKVNAFVIAVGNLTVGGSGKTPLTQYIVSLLKRNNFKVGVISRGYGRRSKGYHLVSDGKNILTDVNISGDEMHLILSECNVPAAVSEDRVEGAERLINQSNVDVIVLDDAFQHRWISRNLNILLFDQPFWMRSSGIKKMMLPCGNLREPISSVNRADAIVFNKKFMNDKTSFKNLFPRITKLVFEANYTHAGFVDVKTGESYSHEEFRNHKVLIVSGIAYTHSFLNALHNLNIDTKAKLVFRDHKNYVHSDVEKIRKEFYASNAHCVITTQKDAVKLLHFKKELDDVDIYFLKIKMNFENSEEFDSYILRKITEQNNESITMENVIN